MDAKETRPGSSHCPAITKQSAINRRNILLGTSTLVAAAAMTSSGALAQAPEGRRLATHQRRPPGSKPNILVIWGDDIGITNISAY